MENAPSGIFLIIVFALLILTIVGGWKAFEKAGKSGFGFIIPIYNVYIMTQIANKPGWWILLMIIPGVNLIIALLLYIAFAKAYGKSPGFGIGLLLLGFIFFPILGLGNSQYNRLEAEQV